MRELSLFSGAGGGLLGTVHLLGWRPVGYVEWDEYCCRVLEQRIKDGLLPEAPIWQMDIRDFNARVAEQYAGLVDVVSGGPPCQRFSSSAHGANNSENLWPQMLHTIGIVRPTDVFVENVEGFRRYLRTVRDDLRGMGYCVQPPAIVAAACVGAPHERRRVWIRGHANGHSKPNGPVNDEVAKLSAARSVYWDSKPEFSRMVDGLANRMDRLGATGNGQVPAVAASAWRLLTGDIAAVGAGGAQ